MSQEKKVLLAVAGAGALGAALYTTQGSGDKSPNKTRDKKNMGLDGAGISKTKAAGGDEIAVDPSQEKKVKMTAPRDKLPSGGVGGGAGAGAGGMGARTIELPGTSR